LVFESEFFFFIYCWLWMIPLCRPMFPSLLWKHFSYRLKCFVSLKYYSGSLCQHIVYLYGTIKWRVCIWAKSPHPRFARWHILNLSQIFYPLRQAHWQYPSNIGVDHPKFILRHQSSSNWEIKWSCNFMSRIGCILSYNCHP
jgi:hypothetical protein